MHFEKTGIYHIYNQGNNRQKIFFSRRNYLFFLEKISHNVLPFADILAWCLMPNHFHLMISVNEVELPKDIIKKSSGNEKLSTQSMANNTNILLNHSIGIILASYTRAINIQENRSGSLFRSETKAICLNEMNGISSDWYTSYGITFMKVQIPEYQYLQMCFNYIHNNPVKAHLVADPEDWEFSSYADLKGLRNGTLANIEKVKQLGLVV
jgi:putative transposase